MLTQREQLIPERLRVDREPRPRHLPHLPGEREVIEVLRHRDPDREVDRVPATGNELRRPRRGDDAPAALAAVLLAAVAHEAEAPLDDVDLLGVLVLLGPGLERPATLRAGGHRGVRHAASRRCRLSESTDGASRTSARLSPNRAITSRRDSSAPCRSSARS